MSTTLYKLLFLAFFIAVNALIVDKEVTPRHWGAESTYLEHFGFTKFGTINFTGQSTTTSIFTYICNQREYEHRLRANSWRMLCDGDYSPGSTGIKALLDGLPKQITITTEDVYYFTIIDCALTSDTWEAQVHYDLRSTKVGDHVSLGDIPLPPFYLILMCILILLLIGWIVGMAFNCIVRPTPLHYVILSVIILKLIVVIIVTSYWWIYSTQGKRIDIMEGFKSFLFATSETTFFCSIYFIAKGWRITRSGIPSAELRSTCLCIFLLVCTLLFFSFYNTEYYWLGLMAMYFFLLPKFFSSISQNLQTLDTMLNMITSYNDSTGELSEQSEAVKAKRKLFIGVRTSIVSYLISMLLINSLLKAVMNWELSWIVTVLNDSLMVLALIYVCYCMRPQKGLFFFSRNDMVPFMRLLRRLDEEEESNDGIVPWDLSKTLVVEWPGQMKHGLAFDEEYAKRQDIVNIS